MTDSSVKPKSEDQMPANARQVALGMLLSILHKKQPLDEVWDANSAALVRLEKRDQSFCRLLVLTTLRQKGCFELLLDKYLSARDKLPITVQLVLLLGVAQLLFLKTPAHAAISTSLDLLARERKDIKGVANAVLRKIAPLDADKTIASFDNEKNIPAWLRQSWDNAYGPDLSKKISHTSLQEPDLDLSVKADAPLWAEKLGAQLLPNGSLRLPHSADVTHLEGFAEGIWWVQDAASSLPVQCLSALKDKTVYDLCAAPGGKTAQLAAAGAKVVALDRSKKRLQRLSENMQRLHFAVETRCAEALDFKPESQADSVLLDAPCTATGTLRRHPDLMHLKTHEDVKRLAKTQSALLRHAATLVKPGGVLLYAVCSLQPEEGPQIISAFLQENSAHWQRQPISAAEWGENNAAFAELLTPEGDLRSLPCHWSDFGGMDGFFAARLLRKS